MMEPSDFFGYDFVADPYPGYAWLRKNSPVHQIQQPDGLCIWLLTRYEDVRAALGDPRLSKDPRNAADQLRGARVTGLVTPDGRVVVNNLLNSDAADHRRLKNVIGKAFQPRTVEFFRPWIQQFTDDLLGDLPGQDAVDLIARLAQPLPVLVMCRIMGMAPAEALAVTAWRDDVAYPSYIDVLPTAPDAAGEFFAYFVELLERKRACLKSGESKRPEEHGLVDELVAAHHRGTINDDELIGMVTALFIAGTESTTNFIGNAVLALLTHDEQRHFLRHNPEMTAHAVDELIRYDGPAEKATFRVATEDVCYSGTTIPRGSIVGLVLNSANRDEDVFPAADSLDLSRGSPAHVGFGHGPHFCLGAPLARLETQIVFRSVVDRFPDMRLAIPVEQLRWRIFGPHHGLHALPVVLGA
ncbi:cytochrome P450 family protein [Saccharopolyspora phatthalungensis]|uniref:Cytochrome P450 n=1 Tax=Saccharopolyspora phatthalungensis TaxID=664693 RepID=A0A840QJY6_9PSEU|nr:cytochrome P450 [Saccharopolyspora phatthalungensis]MBB5158413.1 cytochrome P450 [Saccharopolyspora phatthalungensis]